MQQSGKNNIDKGIWEEFEVYPNTDVVVKAKALILNEEVEEVKLITKVGKGYYYSVLNDAGEVADKLFAGK